jgi:hypothetical protein
MLGRGGLRLPRADQVTCRRPGYHGAAGLATSRTVPYRAKANLVPIGSVA